MQCLFPFKKLNIFAIVKQYYSTYKIKQNETILISYRCPIVRLCTVAHFNAGQIQCHINPIG